MSNRKIEVPDIKSQSLLIQRSYSYFRVWVGEGCLWGYSRNPFLFRGPIPTHQVADGLLISPVAIPSYSEVLFLQGVYVMKNRRHYKVSIPSYSEVLFLPIPGATFLWRPSGRNPFLFRGPIPTKREYINPVEEIVAIPSYSEVLFLQSLKSLKKFPGISRNPFLFRGPIPT